MIVGEIEDPGEAPRTSARDAAEDCGLVPGKQIRGIIEVGKLRDCVHTFTVKAGDEVVIEATSAQFDTVLTVHPPTGDYGLRNDDQDGGTTDSRLTFIVEESGTYKVYVLKALTTGNTPVGYKGAYKLTLNIRSAAGK